MSSDIESTQSVKRELMATIRRMVSASIIATSMTLLCFVLVIASRVLNLQAVFIVAIVSCASLTRIVCSATAYKFRNIWIFSYPAISQHYTKQMDINISDNLESIHVITSSNFNSDLEDTISQIDAVLESNLKKQKQTSVQ